MLQQEMIIRQGVWDVLVKTVLGTNDDVVNDLWYCKAIEGFEGQEADLIHNSLSNRQNVG